MSFRNENRLLVDSVNPRGWAGLSSKSPSIPFQMQARLIPHKFRFKSPGDLVKTIMTTIDSNSSGESFLYFDDIITEDDFEMIEKELKAAQLRTVVRFTSENPLNATILRIKAGLGYNIVAQDLYTEIVFKIASIPGHSRHSISPVGATRFLVPGVRSKQGDQGVQPINRVGMDSWPSLIIEVGCSETHELLRLDAEWWLFNSECRTRFFIIATISRDPLHLRIECWKMSPPATGTVYPFLPQCTHDFNIDSAGVVTSSLGSTELLIPYDCIFDHSSSVTQPIILTFPELSLLANKMFRFL
ncbi:hypothetical protein B9Z19DRAFT_1078711 [Tuber borchii]|uniref:Uncharacterized protein n=1 Tax=Tuber borchii TaxID=42251 RepID=A0A2T6ZZ74_TUBBO|nr:hypothetical protein B9Z19DRAFT_1078711 [Tuber borchii]